MSTETRVISVEDDRWLAEAFGSHPRWRPGRISDGHRLRIGRPGDRGGTVVEAIFEAKSRPEEKSIPVLVAGWPEVRTVARPALGPEKLAAAFWPGPLTIVMERDPRLTQAIGHGRTVGVRAPNHAVAQALLRAAGPLATSSANLSGEPSPRTVGDVLRSLGGRIALVIDAGTTPGGTPSTVVECTGEAPLLLRAGPVTMEAVLEAWGRPLASSGP